MARYLFVVHSNAADGRQSEYEAFMTQHVDDILALPGVIWGRRGAVAAAQARPAPETHKFITVFEVETDDLQVFIDEMVKGRYSEYVPNRNLIVEAYTAMTEAAMLETTPLQQILDRAERAINNHLND